jgi:hypothetical protein
MSPHSQPGSLSLVSPHEHEAMPVRATFRGEKGDGRSGPLSPWDFPVIAMCGTCRGTLRKADSVLSDWEHVADPE